MATSVATPEGCTSWDMCDHIYGAIYGQCCGDTIGLLTEFLTKQSCKEAYGEKAHLEFTDKIDDAHRMRWKVGDWTDDSDQMILIMMSLIELDGKVSVNDVAERIWQWTHYGFPSLGDHGGMGIGATTSYVLKCPGYRTDPHAASKEIWEKTGCVVAPNGAVMRTSILGVHVFNDIDNVVENSVSICKTTHYDPRCVASCVAVSCAIAYMLQRSAQHVLPSGDYNINAIIKDSYSKAKPHLLGNHYKKYKKELKKYMWTTKLSELKLDAKDSIGYTYKCMGSGFWALKQHDFRTALEALLMEGGDADTNGAVAGAMLGCKLGSQKLPASWRDKLLHKEWLDEKIDRFLELEGITKSLRSTSDEGAVKQ